MPKVLADEDNGIAHRPAEDRYDLDTVLTKFDHHFGVHNFRNIKRQEFLITKRGQLCVMEYIAELQRKAEYFQYGAQKDGFICDMIINRINDKKCSEKIMEIPADQLTLERVIQTCRHIELTNAHIKTLQENPAVHVARPDKYGKQIWRDKTVQTVSCHFAKSVAKCMHLKIVQHSTKYAMCVVKSDILRRQGIVEDVQQLEVVGSTVVALGQAVAMVVVALMFVFTTQKKTNYLICSNKIHPYMMFTQCKTTAMKRITKSGQ
ncbi:hypothetical protein DPMN_025661 [Dreissena polymorpha]|uniref:Retrotransposon gag domain-containing protein n=1 Tax=Dreissena polymorpha TaxID=45954 RepID=A0A9D4LQ79_DREPO|nr:hypothetical protein DPMN_025661 [Dreissena polymorpha]